MSAQTRHNATPVIDRVAATAFRIPTDAPEADGTIAWDATTLVVAEVSAAGTTGLGYSYTDADAAHLINGLLAKQITGEDGFAIPRLWDRMVGAVRNLGRRGICATAISAIDTALWDLKARLLGQPMSMTVFRFLPNISTCRPGEPAATSPLPTS